LRGNPLPTTTARLWPLLVALPATVALGAAGAFAGYLPRLGPVLLVLLVAAPVLASRGRGWGRRRGADPTRPRSDRDAVVLGMASAAVVLAAVLVATVPAWRAQVDVPLPAAPTVTAGADGATS
jgi:hypothetical protein